jgi:hypothetical protein
MTTVSVLLMASLAAAGQAQAPAPPKITMVTVDGCASGLLLKSARPSTIEEAELIVSPVYKMTGSKAIKSEIKKLNGMQVRVRAELPELPGSRNPSTTIGSTKLTIGTSDDPNAPVVSRAPDPPGLDVQTVTSLERKCTEQ